MWIDEFIECFDQENRSLLSIEKAYRLKDGHVPNTLYKFRRIDEYSLKNLSGDTIWLNSPSRYNDPFDCAATISALDLFSSSIKYHLDEIPGAQELYKLVPREKMAEIRESGNPVREIAQLALAADKSIRSADIPTMIDALEAAIKNVMEPTYTDLVKHVRDGIKLCSFCATMKPITMWSHYADEHKGFCIEYDIEKLARGDIRRRMLFPVIYKDSMFDCTKYLIAAIRDRGTFNNIYARLQALYKSPEWSYEQEWRLVFIGGVIDKEQDYPMPTPSKVFLGAKISDNDKQRIIALCQSKKVECYQMKLRSDCFELDAHLVI